MFMQQIVNGLTVGCSYALVTIGFSMIYGVLGLTNFAHGSFYMLGAYIALTVLQWVGLTYTGLILGLSAAIIICAFMSSGMDRLTLRRIRNKNVLPISALLCTVGVQALINNGIILIYGSENKAFTNFLDFGKFSLGGTVVTWLQIILIGIAIVIMAIVTILVKGTQFGAAMRATSQNVSASRMMGVNVDRVITKTFFIAAIISAISGVMIGLYYQTIETTMATVVGSKAFAAAVLGGIGELPGAVIGGFIIGILETLVAAYVSSGYRDAIAFAILIIVLMIRPQGILGKKFSEKV